MRTLKLHFAADALPTLETFLKRTKEARVFRRAQAVRAVVTGQRLQTVSDTLHLTYSALRKWVHRFATEGTRGLVDRPWVVFQKWRWPFLHCPSKGIAVDKQANDDVVHLCRFRKADGLADQAFNARP
jgi:hypothetical protein